MPLRMKRKRHILVQSQERSRNIRQCTTSTTASSELPISLSSTDSPVEDNIFPYNHGLQRKGGQIISEAL